MSNAPSIPHFVAGTGLQQPGMETLWVSPATFFEDRVVFRADQLVTATSLPSSGAVTKIAYDNVIEDPYSGWSPTNYWWTAPAGYSGWYQVTVTVCTVAPAAEEIILIPYLASAIIGNIPVAGVVLPEEAAGAAGTWYVYLVGGQDAIHGAAAINNASANLDTDLTAGQNSTLEVVWCST